MKLCLIVPLKVKRKKVGSILPVIFLAIAILTIITTMNRLVTAEKTQIGILKALGFKDRKIILHYTTFAIFISVVGSVLGVALGYAIARLIMKQDSIFLKMHLMKKQ